MKRTFDRQATLDGEVRDLARVVRIIRNDLGSISDDQSTKSVVLSGLKLHAKLLIAERKALRRSLSMYGTPMIFDVSQWLKVIPVSEIESASLYFDDDYDKWFSNGSQDNAPVDSES